MEANLFNDGDTVTNKLDGRKGVILSHERLYSQWYYRINFFGDNFTGIVKEDHLKAERPLEWATVQADLRAGVYGDWFEVRDAVVNQMIAEGHEEIGSSDINHVAFGMVKAGDLTPTTIERG